MAFDETRKFDIIDDLKIEKFIKDAMVTKGAKWEGYVRPVYDMYGVEREASVSIVGKLGDSIICHCKEGDVKHIANFDPQTAILLCREILKLREENRELKEEVEYLRQDNMKMEDRIWELEGELEEKD